MQNPLLNSIIPNLINERSNLANLHPNIAAILQHDLWLPKISNTRRCTRQKYRPSLQCRPLRKIRDLLSDIEYHVLGMAILDHFAVIYGFDSESLGVFNHTRCN
jgi:hypothetical protein